MIEKADKTYELDAPPPLYAEKHSYWVCYCDLCRKSAPRLAIDPGRAAVLAQEAGFKTRPGRLRGDPRIWVCPDCQAKPSEVWYTPNPCLTGSGDS